MIPVVWPASRTCATEYYAAAFFRLPLPTALTSSLLPWQLLPSRPSVNAFLFFPLDQLDQLGYEYEYEIERRPGQQGTRASTVRV